MTGEWGDKTGQGVRQTSRCVGYTITQWDGFLSSQSKYTGPSEGFTTLGKGTWNPVEDPW